MPNVGRPSRDCHLCRKRRVKCDLGRPGCQRCLKYGTDCPGYRDEQELVFRSVNPSTAKKRSFKAQDKAAANAAAETVVFNLNALNAGSSSTSSSSSSSGSSTVDPKIVDEELFVDYDDTFPLASDELILSETPLVPSLSQHWTAHSVSIALAVYGQVDFFFNVVSENPHDGPLLWATHLFSRTYVTNLRQPTALSKVSESDNTVELSKYLGRTLSAVASALKTPDGPMRDDIIGAVWMLANYEIIIGSIGRMELDSPWHHHAEGIWGILKTRGKEQLLTEHGRSVFWPTYNMVQIEALTSNKPCPEESLEYLAVLKDFSERVLAYHIAMFMHKVSTIQAKCMKIICASDCAAGCLAYVSLFAAMTEAETTLGQYKTSFERLKHSSDAYILSMYQAALVKVYNCLATLATLCTHDESGILPLEQIHGYRNYCISRVRESAETILVSAPAAIDELMLMRNNVFGALFQALRLVWPLTAVRLMPSTLPRQKMQATQGLLIIGKELGVRQATKRYDQNLPIPEMAKTPRPLTAEIFDSVAEPIADDFASGLRQDFAPWKFLSPGGLPTPVLDESDLSLSWD